MGRNPTFHVSSPRIKQEGYQLTHRTLSSQKDQKQCEPKHLYFAVYKNLVYTCTHNSLSANYCPDTCMLVWKPSIAEWFKGQQYLTVKDVPQAACNISHECELSTCSRSSQTATHILLIKSLLHQRCCRSNYEKNVSLRESRYLGQEKRGNRSVCARD